MPHDAPTFTLNTDTRLDPDQFVSVGLLPGIWSMSTMGDRAVAAGEVKVLLPGNRVFLVSRLESRADSGAGTGITKDDYAALLASLPSMNSTKPPTPVQRRLSRPIDPDDEARLAYQHTVLCQTCLPRSNPGNDVLKWKQINGKIALQVDAGDAWDSAIGDFVPRGLPFGTKPRLILAYLNAEALRRGSPVINIGDSLSGYVKRIRGFDNGREIRAFKEQLSRLSVATVRMATTYGERGFQVNSQVITGIELWPETDGRQRALWPATVQLSAEYFASLQEYAVPLHEADLAALAHSSMALDIYAWLAHRLRRVDRIRPQFIQWPSLMQQFGSGYVRMEHFKKPFYKAVRDVLARYTAAQIDLNGQGMRLYYSPAPVPERTALPRR